MKQSDKIKDMMTEMSDSRLQQCIEDLMGLSNNGCMPMECAARKVIYEMEKTGLVQPGLALFVDQTAILREGARRWLEITRTKR